MKTKYVRNELIKFSIEVFGSNVFENTRKGTIIKHRKSIIYILYEVYKMNDNDIVNITGLNRATLYYHRAKVSYELTIYKDSIQSVAYWRIVIGGIFKRYNIYEQQFLQNILN